MIPVIICITVFPVITYYQSILTLQLRHISDSEHSLSYYAS